METKRMEIVRKVLIESRRQLQRIREERDRAYFLLSTKIPALIKSFRNEVQYETDNTKKSQNEIMEQFKCWIQVLRKNASQFAEDCGAKCNQMSTLLKDNEQKTHDLETQLQSSRGQLKLYEQELTNEKKRADIAERDGYLCKTELCTIQEKLKVTQNKARKLLLGPHNITCSECRARERVKNAMSSLAINYSTENKRMRRKLTKALKGRNDRKQLIVDLSKTNRRLRFEIQATKNSVEKRIMGAKSDFERQIVEARIVWQAQMKKSLYCIDCYKRNALNECSNLHQLNETSQNSKKSILHDEMCQTNPSPPETIVIPIGTPMETNEIENMEWLKSQLDGYENLVRWYRIELNSAIREIYSLQTSEENESHSDSSKNQFQKEN